MVRLRLGEGLLCIYVLGGTCGLIWEIENLYASTVTNLGAHGDLHSLILYKRQIQDEKRLKGD